MFFGSGLLSNYGEHKLIPSISVTGYADVQTAYPVYNLKLKEERTNEIIRVLTILYGMDDDRISGKSMGDTVHPFEVNDSNRVVIAIDVEE
jgi:outer membrane protein OmpA-like peptidoglycan-associated protein